MKYIVCYGRDTRIEESSWEFMRVFPNFSKALAWMIEFNNAPERCIDFNEASDPISHKRYFPGEV